MKITTFSEYQKEANFLKISLDKFLEKHPNLSEDVILLMRISPLPLDLYSSSGRAAPRLGEGCGFESRAGHNFCTCTKSFHVNQVISFPMFLNI